MEHNPIATVTFVGADQAIIKIRKGSFVKQAMTQAKVKRGLIPYRDGKPLGMKSQIFADATISLLEVEN